MSMPIKITRTLFVGVGGTGVKAILRAKQCFLDAYGEVPPMVAFLAVDTDKAVRETTLTSRSGKIARLSDSEICFCGITGSALDIYRNHLTKFQWLPKRNESSLSNLRNTGAGQVRSNGRFLARHNAEGISRLVASKVTEIGKPLPLNSRFAYDTNKDGVEYPTIVNVVGSVAGGTGSGMMLDLLVLIAKTLRESGLNYSITPWMVLPDVFRHMAPGPASSNVCQNAYGAIRELDYLYHLPKGNQNALDFGFDKVYYIDEGIREAYLINSTNKAGVVLQNIDDIADSIGRCMFLPSNEVDSVWDNVRNVAFAYNVRNKEAHYASAGSAEIVYDNHAVASVIENGIVAQICEELTRFNSIGALNEANDWMQSGVVAIQEHGKDQLIDSLLSHYAPYAIVVGKDTDEDDIKSQIFSASEAPYVLDEVKSKEETKISEVKGLLKTKLDQILDAQNGIGAAEAFLAALSVNVEVCKKEMQDEASGLQDKLNYEVDWASRIPTLRNMFGFFKKDVAEALEGDIADYIAQKRDLLRHRWAIQFYTDFSEYIKSLSDAIAVLKVKVDDIGTCCLGNIQTIQNLARGESEFQIYLHSKDVHNFALPDVAETSAVFRSQTKICDLVMDSQEAIYSKLRGFAKNHQAAVNAGAKTIEEVMSKMDDGELRAIFKKVRDMSSPLWATDPKGYLQNAQQLTTVFTIGVFNQADGIIQKKYLSEFTIGAQNPVFASTHETDRITFFQTQCFSPAYAVNNMVGYMAEADVKSSQESYPAYYLDEKWHQRMIIEGFDVMPKLEKDRVLPNWVNAIVYGFVKYDESKKTYYMESEQGDVLSGGFLALGERRDLAFDQFQLKGLDKEVESLLKAMIEKDGRPAVKKVLENAKANVKNYLSDVAQLSPIEQDRVVAKDPAYQMVRDLLEKEVTYLKEIQF